MMKMTKALFVVLLCLIPVEALAVWPSGGGKGKVNFGTSLPSTCSVGDLFYDTDADTTGSLYVCRAANTWKENDDDGEAGGAPSDAQYWIGAADGSLSAEVVVNSAASLETAANLGAFFSDYADDANATAMRTTLGLAIGTDVLAPDGDGSGLTGVPALVDECKGATFQVFGSSDATPDVSNGGSSVHPCWQVHQSTSPTITDFDDGDDHSEYSAGDKFLLLFDYTATIDMSDNSNIEGNSNVDPTGSASQEMYLIFRFDGAKWICDLTGGWSTPTTLSVSAIEITTLEASELNDTSDPHLLTASELKSHYISNAESTGADEWDFPARSEGWDFCFVKEVDQNVTLDPNGSEQWQYRTDNSGFTQLAGGEALVNTTAGESSICCFSTETAVYCSGDANWAEETP